MIYRELGRTGIRVSAVAFGAGPVSGLMTGSNEPEQLAAVRRAIDAGINWFDTAPGYGQGKSEANLGRVLAELGVGDAVSVATKVRVPLDALDRIGDAIRASIEGSLQRLHLPRVTLLQLHNGITERCGDEPSSLSPREILKSRGVAETMVELREAGLVRYLGLTGTGVPAALREVVRAGPFDTIQVPFNLLNPSAGGSGPVADGDIDYGNIMSDCTAMRMGIFAIRVFAGGALVGDAPSAHTLTTPYFPLDCFRRDAGRALRLREALPSGCPIAELALRFVLAHPSVSSAIIGFGCRGHVDELNSWDLQAPIPPELAPLA